MRVAPAGAGRLQWERAGRSLTDQRSVGKLAGKGVRHGIPCPSATAPKRCQPSLSMALIWEIDGIAKTVRVRSYSTERLKHRIRTASEFATAVL